MYLVHFKGFKGYYGRFRGFLGSKGYFGHFRSFKGHFGLDI